MKACREIYWVAVQNVRPIHVNSEACVFNSDLCAVLLFCILCYSQLLLELSRLKTCNLLKSSAKLRNLKAGFSFCVQCEQQHEQQHEPRLQNM